MPRHRSISPHDLESVGHDLHRPECVLPMPSGDIFVCDWRGGITAIHPDGSQETTLARPPASDLRPNGIARAPDGSFVMANLGESGGVWRMRRDGTTEPFVTEVDGVPLPPANFVTIDHLHRAWISVSTRKNPRLQAWRPDVADGFVVLADGDGARIVADGLGYTNEVRPDPSGEWLYVVETYGRRLVRFRIGAAGALGPSETVVTLGQGCFPDGFAFDDTGAIWITSLVSNRLLRLHDGGLETVMEDVNAGFVDAVETAFTTGGMRPEFLGPIPGTTLQQLTSIAFGGADRRTAYLGSLAGTCVYRFRADVAGAPADHWQFEAP